MTKDTNETAYIPNTLERETIQRLSYLKETLKTTPEILKHVVDVNKYVFTNLDSILLRAIKKEPVAVLIVLHEYMRIGVNGFYTDGIKLSDDHLLQFIPVWANVIIALESAINVLMPEELAEAKKVAESLDKK
jgi:hypothetical protein